MKARCSHWQFIGRSFILLARSATGCKNLAAKIAERAGKKAGISQAKGKYVIRTSDEFRVQLSYWRSVDYAPSAGQVFGWLNKNACLTLARQKSAPPRWRNGTRGRNSSRQGGLAWSAASTGPVQYWAGAFFTTATCYKGDRSRGMGRPRVSNYTVSTSLEKCERFLIWVSKKMAVTDCGCLPSRQNVVYVTALNVFQLFFFLDWWYEFLCGRQRE